MRLSEHFTLAEMTVSQAAARRGISNLPPPEIIERLRRTAGEMERVRELLGGKVISVSSGYRSPAVNALVGGARNSGHLHGFAVDFNCWSFGSPYKVCKAIEASAIKYDQLIHEFGDWIHVSFDPSMRQQELTVDRPAGSRRSRTRPGIIAL